MRLPGTRCFVSGSAKPVHQQGCCVDRNLAKGRVEEKSTSLRQSGMDSQLWVQTMSRPSWLQKLYWMRFSKPVEERALYKHLVEHPVASVLEIGVGNGARMQRIAKLVQLPAGAAHLRYIGIDEFESAQDSAPRLSLKQAHQMATQLGLKASLIPGDHKSAIPRVAHKMGAVDLVIVNGGLNPQEPSVGFIGTWLNRLAHSESTVIGCEVAGQALVVIAAKNLELSTLRRAG